VPLHTSYVYNVNRQPMTSHVNVGVSKPVINPNSQYNPIYKSGGTPMTNSIK